MYNLFFYSQRFLSDKSKLYLLPNLPSGINEL